MAIKFSFPISVFFSLKQQGSTIIGTTLPQQQNNQSQSESERDTEIRKQLRFSQLNPSTGRRSSLRTALQQYQKMKKQTDREKKSEIRKETKFVQVIQSFYAIKKKDVNNYSFLLDLYVAERTYF